jgi:hypothetical protein
MIKEIVKIQIPNKNLDFSTREKFINTELQKIIDSYNNKGFTVLSHSILNKNGSNASFQFELMRVLG